MVSDFKLNLFFTFRTFIIIRNIFFNTVRIHDITLISSFYGEFYRPIYLFYSYIIESPIISNSFNVTDKWSVFSKNFFVQRSFCIIVVFLFFEIYFDAMFDSSTHTV